MLFWICIGLTVVFAIIGTLASKEIETGFFISFIGVCVAFIGIGMIAGTFFEDSRDEHISQRYNIVSLQDNEGTEGSISGGFFFVTGTIGTYQFYSWYERQSDGSYESRQVSTREYSVKIWEEPASARPKAIKHEVCHLHNEPSWLSSIDFSLGDECETDHWDLYVPQGTIRREFNLNGAG